MEYIKSIQAHPVIWGIVWLIFMLVFQFLFLLATSSSFRHFVLRTPCKQCYGEGKVSFDDLILGEHEDTCEHCMGSGLHYKEIVHKEFYLPFTKK